ncbi:hypothetical protein TWF730_007953 [Orbilia blumenaviensis]|uniref:Uncharacterized protein n=1 Tax=Orbilia blumenaviensis TaxID=1796055 RepID=A0AAV9V9Z1_9PEZI
MTTSKVHHTSLPGPITIASPLGTTSLLPIGLLDTVISGPFSQLDFATRQGWFKQNINNLTAAPPEPEPAPPAAPRRPEMAPKNKKNNKKRNSVVQIPKENGDIDSSLNSPAVETPMSENQEFVTPADRPDNPLDKPVANGAAATDPIDNNKDTMAKAEGDEAAAAWGLDDDKGKGIVGEPDAIPDTAEKLENGSVDHKPAEVNGEEHKGEQPRSEVPKDDEPEVDKTKDDEPKTGDPETKVEDSETKAENPEAKTEDSETKLEEPKTEEQETKPEEPKSEEPKSEEPNSEEPKLEEPKSEEPKEDIPTAKTEEPSDEEKKPIPPADLDIPDTAEVKDNVSEDLAEKTVTEPVADEHAGSKSLADELAAVEAAGEEEDETPAEKPAVEETEAGKLMEDESKTENPTEVVPVEEQSTEEKADVPAPGDPGATDPATEATAPVEDIPKPEAKVDAPEAVRDEPGIETATTEAAPEGADTAEEKTAPEGDAVVAVEATPGDEYAPQVIEEPVIHTRPIMEAPKPPTLPSLTSTDRDFTSTRYQSTTSPQFLNKPHQPANHSLDLDDRNMQSSINNWYKKVFSFADSLNWRPGWDHPEEFDYLVRSIEAPLSQVSLAPAQEWWAEKPKDPSIDWDKIDEAGAKYEEFWEWKSKIALTAICANFACREILGKTVFGLDEKMTKKLGLAMSVFIKDFGDDITATKFRHMTLKLLQESKSFGSSSRKQLVKLSQELANVLSPLTSFLPVEEPRTEEEKQQQAHYSPLTLALYEKVLFATHILHDTIQKDLKYFALFHPVPGVEFDETTMEESTFQNLGAGKGAVALVARPGLVRLGLPRGGEPEDIVIVHKALVVREDALEEALKHFDTPVDDVPPAVPADVPAETEDVKVE